MKKILCIFMVFLLLMSTGCIQLGKGDTDLTSEGFNQINNYTEDGAEITLYTGSKSGEEAKEIFTNWAQDNGWNNLDEDFDYFGDLTGMLFEKGNEVMHINIVDAGTVSTVMVSIVPDDISESNTPSETLQPTQTPTPEYNILSDISEISTYIDEVDIDIFGQEMKYKFFGETDLDGETTQYLSVTNDATGLDVEIWTNDSGDEFYMIKSNGEVVGTEYTSDANYFVETLMVFFESSSPENHDWDEFEKSTGSVNLGSGEMETEIYTYEFLSAKTQRELVDTGDFYLLIAYWQFDDADNREGYQITRLILK